MNACTAPRLAVDAGGRKCIAMDGAERKLITGYPGRLRKRKKCR